MPGERRRGNSLTVLVDVRLAEVIGTNSSRRQGEEKKGQRQSLETQQELSAEGVVSEKEATRRLVLDPQWTGGGVNVAMKKATDD